MLFSALLSLRYSIMVESNHKLGVRLVFWHRQLSRVDTSRRPERKIDEQLKRSTEVGFQHSATELSALSSRRY